MRDFDMNASEITMDARGVSENTYGPDLNLPEVVAIRAELFAAFPETLQEDFSTWDMIGKTVADGRNYFEDTISLTYKDVPSAEKLSEFGVPATVHCIDCHTVKFKLASLAKTLKVYDGNFAFYRLDLLPPGATVAHRFGVGRHFGDPRLAHLRDLYFFHPSVAAVSAHFDTALPEVAGDSVEGTKLFGVCYDARDRRIVKLKRYLYPGDWSLAHPERI